MKLAPDALSSDPSLAQGWRAAYIELHGLISAKNTSNVQRSIQDALQRGDANLVFIRLDSPGGNIEISQQLAAMLAELDETQVRTVAVIEHEARADAALIALACDELVMTPDALLGGPGAVELSEFQLESLRPALRQLAQLKNRDWSLLTAMVERDLSVYRFSRPSGGPPRYLCDEEHSLLENPGDWERGALVPTRAGIDAARAVELGLARDTVGTFNEIATLFNIDSKVEPLKSSWVASRLEYLASQPWFSNTLLFVAFFALISEASAPGLGVPGFISALCFLLFFWAQFLNGTAGWLEVTLFLSGVVFVGFELLVIPGFGVFGLGGLLMIITSIVLASQTFVVPSNTYQWQRQTGSLLSLVIGLSGLFVGGLLMRRYLPHTPWLRHMLLTPPQADPVTTGREGRYGALLHQHGFAMTKLAPTGKARFGEEIVSVQTEGELLEKGEAVQVIAVLGNRIVVKGA